MEFHGSMHHIPNQKRQQFIKQWLEYVELAERRDDLVKKLWGNEPKFTNYQRTLARGANLIFGGNDGTVRPAKAVMVGNASRFEQAGNENAVDNALYG
ncbi:MAG TPA: hypothetical protein VIQ31_13870 [Phormidium sp.]